MICHDFEKEEDTGSKKYHCVTFNENMDAWESMLPRGEEPHKLLNISIQTGTKLMENSHILLFTLVNFSYNKTVVV